MCYETRKAGGALGCCGTGSAVLGEVMRAHLFDPLETGPRKGAGAAARQAVAAAASQSWTERIRAVSRALDTSVESGPLMGLRARESVRVLLSRGFDAEALVRADNNRRQLLPLLAQYSVADLRKLGFTWRALVGAGLTAETWDRRAMPIPDLVQHMQLDAALVLETLCTGPEDLPSVRLDPAEWRELCGTATTPAQFFLQSGMPGTSLRQFGFSMQAWAQVMGLQRPIADFKLSPLGTQAFLEAAATADDSSAEAEFKFYFPQDKLVLPQDDRDGVNDDDNEDDRGARGRTGVGRGRARPRPARLGAGAAHVRRGAGGRGPRGRGGARAHPVVGEAKPRKDAKGRLNLVKLDLPL